MNLGTWPQRFRLRTPPHAWAEDFDFAGPRVRTAWWAWLVLGLGVALALKVSDDFERVRVALDDGRAQLKRLSRAERQRQLAQQAPSVRDDASKAMGMEVAPALSGPALPDALTLSLLLGYPWGDVLNQLEAQAARHQAVMLGLGVDLASLSDASRVQPVWRLQAAVHGDADAMAWTLSLPQGRLTTRERLSQPFTGLSGSYELKVQVQMSPLVPVVPAALASVVKS